jgi:hypothetical protein
MINLKHLILDLFSFGCYTSYLNIKKMENYYQTFINMEKLIKDEKFTVQLPKKKRKYIKKIKIEQPKTNSLRVTFD